MSKKNILIIYGDPSLQKAIARYLAISGYSVDCVTDLAGFDDYILQHKVDMLIIDQMMPGENGLAIIKQIRASGNNLLIFMISSFAEDAEQIIDPKNGANDYLSKPPNLIELRDRVRALLKSCH